MLSGNDKTPNMPTMAIAWAASKKFEGGGILKKGLGIYQEDCVALKMGIIAIDN